MRKGCWIALGVFACLGLVCSCGGFLLWRGLVTIISEISSDQYALVAKGDHLYVQSYYEPRNTFDVVSGKSGLARITLPVPTDSKSRIDIDDGKGAKVSKEAPSATNELWSELNQAAYWVTEVNDRNTLWRWTRKDGFRNLLESDDLIEDLQESLDGNYLCAKVASYDESSEEVSNSFVTFSVGSVEKKVYEIYDDFSDSVMLSKGRFLITGDNTYHWEAEKDKRTYLNIEGDLEECLTFQGRVWAIRRKVGKLDVVRLNATATKVDQATPFPAAFLEKEKLTGNLD